ncbi:MAG: TIGR03087 family PEP-CTERM/XrtA system glycosyltransferase [Gammaproteobacteria bacterium]|nr:TIGR03087 family PEP-CTERM/XrtA system glycosyltransferase [Gammaproteobacteria bacterium]
MTCESTASDPGTRPDLLFLAHRIPFPPNKGDKIRSFHLLRHLAGRYRVHLGAFIDVPEDWQHAAALREWCVDVHLEPLRPWSSRIRGVTGLLRGEALGLPYYRRASMQAWVRRKVFAEGTRRAVIYSSTMAQYLDGPEFGPVCRVLDMVDVDSQKWTAYAARKPWPASWLYRREGERLLRFERAMAARFDHTLFVSAAEAALFRQLAPESAARVSHYDNGVDAGYFNPEHNYPSPYADGDLPLVFTGAMDYWANVDAVVWFAREVFPRVLQAVPAARFVIVGGRPAAAVQTLARLPGVTVTGAIRDIRPYVAHAIAAVAPMRIARGLQNKVLEAMAMAKPVIATPAAMEGISAGPEFAALVADAPAALATIAIEVLRGGLGATLGALGRNHVMRCHDWTRTVQPLTDLLERGT